MRKLNFVIAVLMLFSSVSLAQMPKNDWSEWNLKGKVKLISQNYYKAVEKNAIIVRGEKDGIIVSGEKNNSETETFNENGYKIENVSYNADGNIDGKTIWKYDARGINIEVHWYKSENISNGKQLYKYDSNLNCIEKIIYDSAGAISYKTEYQYNNDRKMVQYSEFHRGGSLRTRSTLKYDSKGNKIETNHYWPTGEHVGRTIYKYDEKGNPIENEYHRDLLPDGKFKNMYKSTRKHNENGHLVEVNGYDTEKGSLLKRTYQYEYDKKLNWIRRIEFKDDKAISIIERVIVYY